jgi:hypothetical protein
MVATQIICMLPNLLSRHIACRGRSSSRRDIGVPENLWWDELVKLILNPATRQEEVSLSLNCNHYVYTFPPETGDSGGPDPQNKWRAWGIDGRDLVVDVTSLDAGEGHNDSYAGAALQAATCDGK